MIDVISSSKSGVASGEWGVGETDFNVFVVYSRSWSFLQKSLKPRPLYSSGSAITINFATSLTIFINLDIVSYKINSAHSQF